MITKEILLENERIDDLQRNNLRIIQNPEKFCFGIDAVLLSSFADCREGDEVLDIGTGTGIIPILMSAKTKAGHFAALEIQKESADMAARSVSLNELDDRIKIVNGDIKNASELFKDNYFDVITTNPPYMIESHGLTNPDEPKAIARHEIKCNLEDIIKASALLLKSKGKFYMVHRPFRLSEIMVTLTKYGLEPKRMQLVHPFADKEPNMVLIEAMKGAKPRITIEKPLIIYKSPGVYTDEVYKIYGYSEE